MALNIGVVSRSFPQLSNEQVGELLATNGFRCTELCFTQTDSNYWTYNGRADLSVLTEEESEGIVTAYRKNGIEVTSIGVFTNLLEQDERELELNLAYFVRLMQVASHNRIPYVATECGFIPGKRGIRAETYETAYGQLVENFRYLAAKAELYNVCITLEPCVLDVIPSAKRMADFINQVGSERIRVLLDPANLIANSSEEDMFRYLAPHVGYFHGKDRKVNDTYGRVIGDGDIQWPLFLDLYHKYTEGVPFILEYVNMDNFKDIRDRVLKYDGMREQGIIDNG